MADPVSLGQAGLQGWRAALGDRIAPVVAQRSPLSEDQVRSLVGAAFFALSVLYVYKTLAAAARQVRS